MTWRTQENTVVVWVPSHRNCICSLTWFKSHFLPFVFHFVPQLYQPSRPGPLWFISSQWCPDSVLQDIWPGSEIFPQGWVFGWWCIEFGCQSHLSPGWVHGKRVARADNKSLPPQLSWKRFCHHWRSPVSLLWCHREGGQVSCTSHQSDRSHFPFPQGNHSFFLLCKSSTSLYSLTQKRRQKASLFPILIQKKLVPTALAAAGASPAPSSRDFPGSNPDPKRSRLWQCLSLAKLRE